MADVRSDIYSLGCTLYYMLTARPPFPEGTVLQKLLQHQADEVPDPRQINPDIPDEIAEFLRRMLAKDPRQRFQQPGELIAELLVVADQLDLRPMTTGQFWIAPQQGLAFWERHLPWIAPVAALILIVLGVEWFGSSSAPPGLLNPEDPRMALGASPRRRLSCPATARRRAVRRPRWPDHVRARTRRRRAKSARLRRHIARSSQQWMTPPSPARAPWPRRMMMRHRPSGRRAVSRVVATIHPPLLARRQRPATVPPIGRRRFVRRRRKAI